VSGTEIQRHEFSTEHELHLFEFDDLCIMHCPDWQEDVVSPNLGAAVDWALGHACTEDVTP